VIPGASSTKVIVAFKHSHLSRLIELCSGYVEEQFIVRGLKTGEFDYVKKPYRSYELISNIYSALNVS
jgi:DNA-binding response OmpR family regulator